MLVEPRCSKGGGMIEDGRVVGGWDGECGELEQTVGGEDGIEMEVLPLGGSDQEGR